MSGQVASDNADVGPSGDVAALALVVAIIFGFFAGSVLAYWPASGYIGLLERQAEFYHEKFDYYFDGANKRRYIELCRGADGEVDVLFKDECAQ